MADAKRHSLSLAIVFLLTLLANAADLTGKVTNAQGGEPLSEVQVSLVGTALTTSTSPDGAFHLANVPGGSYILQISAVGYRTVTTPLASLADADRREFLISLVPDNFHHTETVEVKADIYHAPDWPAIGDMTLTSTELQETSSVLANDPFRSIQTLPGVSSSANNDFFAQFSVMGAPYERVGIYVDDVFVPNLLHTVPSYPDAPTLSLLTGSDIADLRLMPVAYPVRYAGTSGAALAIRTRDGDPTPPLFHVSTGMAASEFLTQGGVGQAHKSTWLFGARKSYISYLERIFGNTRFSEDGFYDLNLKLTIDLTHNQTLSLYAVGGETSINDPHPPADPTILKKGTNNLALARLGWRWTANPNLLVDARAAFVRSGFEEDNPSNQFLQKSLDREWSAGANVSWSERAGAILQAGYSSRRPHQNFADQSFNSGIPQPFSYQVSDLRQNLYLQQSLPLWKDRVRVQGGLRWDRLDSEREQSLTGQASVSLLAARDTLIEAGWAHYAQLPPRGGINAGITSGGSLFGEGALPLQSSQYLLAVERRLGERSRLRAEVFARQYNSRIDIYSPVPVLLLNSALVGRDYSHGLQIILQRRSENRLSGWVGYTLTYAQSRFYQVQLPPPLTFFGFNTPYSPTFDDQRHTVNLFASYRVTPSLRCSLKALYGSGFPVTSYPLPILRLGPYQRLDLRVDKSWALKRWKLTLYAELLNATNHDNRRLEGFMVSPSGQLQLKTIGGIPVTPTAGIAVDF